MDIAITIEYLTPLAEYEGSVSDNLKSSYDAIRWLDDRSKPKWEEIQNSWRIVNKKEQNKKRIAELKRLLAESDFRMTTDYFASMTEPDQIHWTTQRANWRAEINELEQ